MNFLNALIDHYCLLIPSLVFSIQRPSDDESPDLTGSGPDLVQLGVPQQPPGRVVVDVPVAAQDLELID